MLTMCLALFRKYFTNTNSFKPQTNKNLQNSANIGATKVVEIAPVCKSDTGRQSYLEISRTKLSSSPPFPTKQKPCSSEILKSGFKCGMLDQGSHFQQFPCQGVYWKQSFVWHLLKNIRTIRTEQRSLLHRWIDKGLRLPRALWAEYSTRISR